VHPIPDEQKTQEVLLLLEENMFLREQIHLLRDDVSGLRPVNAYLSPAPDASFLD
jgi:cell division protein FtsB